MTSEDSALTSEAREGIDDAVLPFTVEALDLRGRIARLGPSIDTILRRHKFPEPVARLVGEASALAVLLGTALKSQGRFQFQTKSDGPVSMIVVDVEAPGLLRATARFDAERVAALGPRPAAPALLGTGHLAMTIDQGSAQNRYQGVVALEGQGLEEAADQYFRQSEQIPTRVRLAVAEQIEDGSCHWRAGGLMVQFLPASPERMRQADLPPGDAPEGRTAGQEAGEEVPSEDDAWVEARSLMATVEDHELVDPAVSNERLLYRLFHERGVRVFPAQAIEERCRCSRQRVLDMVRSFSGEERREMVADDGTIAVTCEFCSRSYRLDPTEIEAEIAKPD